MTITEFIENFLIKEFKEIQQEENHHYISFSLISQGIEFLGACLDSHSFGQDKLGEVRFRRAINSLFPKSYRQYNTGTSDYDLYKNLRCGMLHVFLPNTRLGLIRRAEKGLINARHLEIKTIRGVDRLILVSEDLFEDYENACRVIIKMIQSGTLHEAKFSGDLLSTASE